MSPQPSEFGRRLRAARERRGVGQAELGRRLGHPNGQVIYAWEVGKRQNCTAATLAALADALGVSMDWLWGVDPVIGGLGYFRPDLLTASDGDSGVLTTRWRAADIDCPEAGEPNYERATAFTRSWLAALPPRARVAGIDRYERLLLMVRSGVTGGTLQDALVEAGYARRWTKEPPR